MSKKIAVIGECMLELNQLPADQAPSVAFPLSMSYGGDTLNTCVYMGRVGVKADYMTALGDDAMSEWMLQQWGDQGVGSNLVARSPGKRPGLYMVQLDEHGERSFIYWRDDSAARQFFSDSGEFRSSLHALSDYECVYLSGISLALMGDQSREALFNFLQDYRTAGGRLVFDSNYRPALWASLDETRRCYERIYGLAHTALPTFDDEQNCFGEHTEADLIARLQGYGVQEIVLKQGELGCLIADESGKTRVPTTPVKVVDTTSAGDSFNAGYLAGRLSGRAPQQAALWGHQLAGQVVQKRGAIVETVPINEH